MLNKRLFDIVFTIPGVILLFPVFLVISVWIKLDSTGSILFRQERVGLRGKLFRINKFRTMVVNAEQLGKQITVGHDRRITKAGFFLRKYKLDELPQLFNVIMGDMSLVGPRPEVPRFVAHYPVAMRDCVLSVLPGLTDFASIAYKDENDLLSAAEDPEKVYIEQILPEKLKYYVRYVNERTVLLDLKLILRTLGAIINKKSDASLGGN